jgi:hypothetical protein
MDDFSRYAIDVSLNLSVDFFVAKQYHTKPFISGYLSLRAL